MTVERPPRGRLRAAALIVLDSVGIGGAPDAHEFGDEGSATLQHVAEAIGGLDLPNLEALGLGRIAEIAGVKPVEQPRGIFGSMVERSAGKDTTTGHWEIAGVILDEPFPTYPEGFPPQVLRSFEQRTGVDTLGNVAASGTEIIERLGEEHLATGKPIVYTSADSVFQIAAHVDVVPLERLYEMCRIAREILDGPHRVARVIARPFDGAPGAFRRTADRHDFSVAPPHETVLDALTAAGLEVRGVGKIHDIFAGRGVTSSRATSSNDDGVDAVIEDLADISAGLVFANLVDFDSSYGHRNDPEGYAAALAAFDQRLPEIMEAVDHDGGLLITADHGNDPTTTSTDHSRERVPVVAWTPQERRGIDVGERATFADCGATVADLLGVRVETPGASFADDVSPMST